MIVCQCLTTNEATIRRLAAQGADTVGAIGRACGAGTDCGNCLMTIRAVLDECRDVELDPAHHSAHSIAFDPVAVAT